MKNKILSDEIARTGLLASARLPSSAIRCLGLALGGLLLAGCVAVPKTEVSGRIGDQPFKIVSPKDSDLAGLDISVETNGTVRVHLDKLQARMNPDVVGQTAAGQAQIVSASLSGAGGIAGNITAEAIKAYLSYLGVPATAPARTNTNAGAK